MQLYSCPARRLVIFYLTDRSLPQAHRSQLPFIIISSKRRTHSAPGSHPAPTPPSQVPTSSDRENGLQDGRYPPVPQVGAHRASQAVAGAPCASKARALCSPTNAAEELLARLDWFVTEPPESARLESLEAFEPQYGEPPAGLL